MKKLISLVFILFSFVSSYAQISKTQMNELGDKLTDSAIEATGGRFIDSMNDDEGYLSIIKVPSTYTLSTIKEKIDPLVADGQWQKNSDWTLNNRKYKCSYINTKNGALLTFFYEDTPNKFTITITEN